MRQYPYVVLKEDCKESDCLDCCEQFTENDPKFIIFDETKRKFCVYPSYEEFLADETKSQTLHEIIRGMVPQKLKFDLDAKAAEVDPLPEVKALIPPTEPELLGDELFDAWLATEYQSDLLQYEQKKAQFDAASAQDHKRQWLHSAVLDVIKKTFSLLYDCELKPKDIVICNSSANHKFSQHYIITNFYVANHMEAKFFTATMVGLMDQLYKSLIDDGVNKSFQCFRMPNSHKAKDPTRTKHIISNHTFEDGLITRVCSTPLPALSIPAEKHNIVEFAGNEAEVLRITSAHTTGFTFNARHHNLFLFRCERPSHCNICACVHDCDNTLMLTVLQHGFINLHCQLAKRFTGANTSLNIGRIATDTQPATRFQNFDIRQYLPKGPIYQPPEEFSILQYNEPLCRDLQFTDQYDTILLKSLMGTGKTKALL
ncbi:hypothetical protein QOT17_022444 [Balamuthia mandrillaris]